MVPRLPATGGEKPPAFPTMKTKARLLRPTTLRRRRPLTPRPPTDRLPTPRPAAGHELLLLSFYPGMLPAHRDSAA